MKEKYDVCSKNAKRIYAVRNKSKDTHPISSDTIQQTFISGKTLFHLYHNYDARASFHNNAGKENLIKGNL